MDSYNTETPSKKISVPGEIYEKIGFISGLFQYKTINSYSESKKWLEDISSKIHLKKERIRNLFSYSDESKCLYYLSKRYRENADRWVSKWEISNNTRIIEKDIKIYRHLTNDKPTKGGFLGIIQARRGLYPGTYTDYKLEKTKFCEEFSNWYMKSIENFPNTLTFIRSATNIEIPANMDHEKLKAAMETLSKLHTISRKGLMGMVGEVIFRFLWNTKSITLKVKDESNTENDIFSKSKNFINLQNSLKSICTKKPFDN